MKFKEATINIKLPIEIDEHIRHFILLNINMRRQIWNDFVDKANKYKDEYNHYNEFNTLKYNTIKIYKNILIYAYLWNFSPIISLNHTRITIFYIALPIF